MNSLHSNFVSIFLEAIDHNRLSGNEICLDNVVEIEGLFRFSYEPTSSNITFFIRFLCKKELFRLDSYIQLRGRFSLQL